MNCRFSSISFSQHEFESGVIKYDPRKNRKTIFINKMPHKGCTNGSNKTSVATLTSYSDDNNKRCIANSYWLKRDVIAEMVFVD